MNKRHSYQLVFITDANVKQPPAANAVAMPKAEALPAPVSKPLAARPV